MAIQDALPRSRITLTYRTTITGEPKMVELPLRILVAGDLTQGTVAPEKKADLEERQLYPLNGSNLSDVMREMNMVLTMDVGNWFTGKADKVQIPITSMKSFHPDELAKQIPDVRSLLLMKRLLEELQSQVANRKALRKELKDVFNRKRLGDTQKDLTSLSYDRFRLPEELKEQARKLLAERKSDND